MISNWLVLPGLEEIPSLFLCQRFRFGGRWIINLLRIQVISQHWTKGMHKTQFLPARTQELRSCAAKANETTSGQFQPWCWKEGKRRGVFEGQGTHQVKNQPLMGRAPLHSIQTINSYYFVTSYVETDKWMAFGMCRDLGQAYLQNLRGAMIPIFLPLYGLAWFL